MAAVINNSAKNHSASSASTLTVNFAVGGSNRVLYVAAFSGAGTPANVSSVKWQGSGGTSLTQLGSTLDVGPYWKLSLWRLIAPTAATDDVYVTWSAAQDERLVIAIAVSDADQTTPNGTVATGTASTSQSIGINAAAVVGDLTIGFGAFGDENGDSRTMSATSSQTSLQEIEGADTTYECLGAGWITAASTSQAHNWSLSGGSGPTHWGAFAFAVNAASGGGGGTTVKTLAATGVG